MSNIEDRMKAYQANLQQIEDQEQDKQMQYQQRLNQIYTKQPFRKKAGMPGLKEFDHLIQESLPSQTLNIFAQVDLSTKNRIKDLDQKFINIFKLDQHIDADLITYPTIYCETLEEFYTPIFNMENVSSLIREELLKRAVDSAMENANSGGVYGVNLPGTGCYLNGWLFGAPYQLSAREALEHPELLNRILITAVHEKLGHGFLDIFSSLGQVGVILGSYQLRLAQQFGMQLTTDPVDKVRQQQAQILFSNTIFLNEGWATWLESFFGAHVIGQANHPKHSLNTLNQAVDELAAASLVDEDGIEALRIALMLVLDEDFHPSEDVLAAVKWLHQFDKISADYFMRKCGQPLRYILGELIMSKISLNSGVRCVPFAALIAANISFDPEKISLTDMRELFHNDPQLNPDTRLVMLSKLTIKELDNVMELAFQAENLLNMQVPQYMKAK